MGEKMPEVILVEQTKNTELDPYLSGIIGKVKEFVDILVEYAHAKCRGESLWYKVKYDICLYYERNLIRSGILMFFLDKYVYLNEKIYQYPKEIRLEFQKKLREIVDGGLNKIYPSNIDPIP
jgi:hypothetical protein